MKKYEIIVGGTVIATATTKEEAKSLLHQAKNSFLALVHPVDCFYIKEKGE